MFNLLKHRKYPMTTILQQSTIELHISHFFLTAASLWSSIYILLWLHCLCTYWGLNRVLGWQWSPSSCSRRAKSPAYDVMDATGNNMIHNSWSNAFIIPPSDHGLTRPFFKYFHVFNNSYFKYVYWGIFSGGSLNCPFGNFTVKWR